MKRNGNTVKKHIVKNEIENNVKPKKKRSKGELIFQIINSVLVVAILGTYAYRLFYWKDLLDKKRLTTNTVFLADSLINNIDLLSTVGLRVNDDGSYTVHGKATNNYVSYSGMIYRVVGINTNNCVVMVAEKSITLMPVETNSAFEETAVYNWLNEVTDVAHTGLYFNSLFAPYGTLSSSAICSNTVDDLNNIGCTQTLDKISVGLLTLSDYKNAGGNESYLNNGEAYWLASSSSSGSYWYVAADGSLSLAVSAAQMYGIRPVITLSYEVIATSGKGTETDPFVISSSAAQTASAGQIGDYISYGDTTWRIESISETGVNAIMEGVIQTADGQNYTSAYGSSNKYTTASGLGKYLNSTYLKTLPDYQNVLVKNTWDFGSFKTSGPFDYRNSFAETYTAYVGVPNLAMMFLNEYPNIFLSNYNFDTDKLIYTVSESNSLFATLLSAKVNVRPVICFQPDLAFTGGSGTADDPYLVGGVE